MVWTLEDEERIHKKLVQDVHDIYDLQLDGLKTEMKYYRHGYFAIILIITGFFLYLGFSDYFSIEIIGGLIGLIIMAIVSTFVGIKLNNKWTNDFHNDFITERENESQRYIDALDQL